MFNLKYLLQDGSILAATAEEFDTLGYYDDLNKPNVIAVPVGDRVLSKGLVQGLLIEDATNTPNIQVSFHNGAIIDAYFPDYTSNSVANILNNPQVAFVVLGNLIVNRNAVREIIKL